MTTRNDRDLDDLLSDDSGKIGSSYRKLGKVEPPRRLDRNVLAEASRAVHGRPRPSRWLLGVGTAAGVLLAAGIAWRVDHDMAQQRETAPMSAPAIESVPQDVVRVEPRAGSVGDSSRGDKDATGEAQSRSRDGETSGSAVSASDAHVERKAANATRKLDEPSVDEATLRKSTPTPAPAAVGKQEQFREQAVPMTPRAQPPPAAAAPMQMPMSEQSKSAPSLRDSAEAEDSVAPEPMQQSDEAHNHAAATESGVTPTGDRRERSATSTDAAVIAEMDRIRVLLRAGQRDAALEALRQLRRQHPDVVLPADLRALDG